MVCSVLPKKKKKKRERELESTCIQKKGRGEWDLWLYEEGAERVEMEQPIDRP